MPKDFSTIVNIRNTKEFASSAGSNDFKSYFETSINYKGFVLESNFDYNARANDAFKREDISLTKDFTAKLVRITAGDVRLPSSTYISSLNIGGVNIARNFSLSPNKLITPVNSKEFILREKAKVRIFINGNLGQVFKFAAWAIQLNRLPSNKWNQ